MNGQSYKEDENDRKHFENAGHLLNMIKGIPNKKAEDMRVRLGSAKSLFEIPIAESDTTHINTQ